VAPAARENPQSRPGELPPPDPTTSRIASRHQNLASGGSGPCDVPLSPIRWQNKNRVFGSSWRGLHSCCRTQNARSLPVGTTICELKSIVGRDDNICTDRMAGVVVRTVRQSAPALARQACSRQLQLAAFGGLSRNAQTASRVRLNHNHGRSFSHSTIWKSAAVPAVERGGSKLWNSADDAVADIQSGSVVLSSGFGLCGVACKFR
jgi:hypothetical protein